MRTKLTKLTNWQKGFLFSAGILLLITGGAKQLSVLDKAHALDVSDPIFGISFRALFLLVGQAEVLIGLACLLSRDVPFRASLVAWLSTGFVFYRIGLVWLGWHKPYQARVQLRELVIRML